MIATHQNPVQRLHPSFMLQVAVQDVGAGDNFEQLWSKQVGDDLFEVCCIPFFAYDMALGDLVRAPDFLVNEVVRRSGNGVVRVAVTDLRDVDQVHPKLHDLLARLEYACEWYSPGYVAVSLEPGTVNGDLFAGLATLGHSVEFESSRV